MLTGLDTADPEGLEAGTATIRELIIGGPVPDEVAREITAAYAGLGAEPYVAVRSSGTAEDLADASFAGLHESFLDVRAADEVVAAVRRCWASLWTSRATAYRANKGFDSGSVGIAVVVQVMVASEVSGVMFIGNPITTATDELLINSSWGLGEAIVGGITTPDQYVAKWTDLRITERTPGGKEVQVVRNPVTGLGTVTQDVPAERRSVLTLSDEQVSDLAELGRSVAEYYDGLPQDIEWGYADGGFVLLQSRPITGVEFSWDCDVDGSSRTQPAEEDGEYWTRAWVDEAWTGAITPLFYSVRGPSWVVARDAAHRLWGQTDLNDMRYFKFYKGEAYSNLSYEREYNERTMPPPFRTAGVWDHLPGDWSAEFAGKPFSYLDYAKLYTRLNLARPQRDRLWGWMKHSFSHYFNGTERGPAYAAGLPEEKLRKLSDTGLKQYVDRMVRHEDQYNTDWWTPCFIYLRDMTCLLKVVVDKWYTGDNPSVFIDLLTGVSERTPALIESHTLWALAQRIRGSDTLSAAFAGAEPHAFFAECRNSDDGRAFLADYHEFLQVSGHRGHTDRDVFFPRRSEDPVIDYNALRGYLDLDRDPEDREQETAARRAAVIQDVVDNIRPTSMGALKVEAFKILMDWTEKFIVIRDTERNFIDRSTFTLRRAFLEVNRRLLARGRVESDSDVWFLTMEELWPVLSGYSNTALTRAKIAGRKRDHARFNSREWTPPKYLHGYQPVDLDAPVIHDGDGVFTGIGTSSGSITGTARIIRSLSEIGRLNKHEILVCNATDPGWTSAFNIIDGIVTETGGALAHAACLAREYGLPAAQIAGAMQLIPDGATITVDGGSGRVTMSSSWNLPVASRNWWPADGWCRDRDRPGAARGQPVRRGPRAGVPPGTAPRHPELERERVLLCLGLGGVGGHLRAHRTVPRRHRAVVGPDLRLPARRGGHRRPLLGTAAGQPGPEHREPRDPLRGTAQTLDTAVRRRRGAHQHRSHGPRPGRLRRRATDAVRGGVPRAGPGVGHVRRRRPERRAVRDHPPRADLHHHRHPHRRRADLGSERGGLPGPLDGPARRQPDQRGRILPSGVPGQPPLGAGPDRVGPRRRGADAHDVDPPG